MSASNQVYDMAKDIAASLGARKYPTPIIYGPERTKRTKFTPAITIERDRKANDGTRAALGVRVNPRKQFIRDLAIVVLVYMQSSAPGARIVEHEAECDQLVDAFLGELQDWVVGAKLGTDPQITESRYLAAADLAEMSADGAEGLELWPGVVYRIKFKLPRGVLRRDYDGAAQLEGAPARVGGDVEIAALNGQGSPEIVTMP